ncbi:hypothetical protein Bca52824_020368 [Brassica carinata]|uniref:Uncharacterized protein n=1 Tax=Brassica carinata TaxID=52824 RepID=A0A8X7VTN3_BRACI|nr:hypothetical protein Bca52824_020368 [Brassica carinata]
MSKSCQPKGSLQKLNLFFLSFLEINVIQGSKWAARMKKMWMIEESIAIASILLTETFRKDAMMDHPIIWFLLSPLWLHARAERLTKSVLTFVNPFCIGLLVMITYSDVMFF